MEKSSNPNDITRYNVACATNDDASTLNFNKNLKKFLVLKDKQSEFFRSIVPPIMFLDSYKYLLYKLHNGLAIPSELQLFSLYNECNNMSQVENLYHNRDDYSLYSLNAIGFFCELPYLGKLSMFKEICDSDNQFLTSVTNLHANDLDEYDVIIDEDFIYKYYVERYKYAISNGAVIQPPSVGTEIAGFIRKTALQDPDGMFDLVSSLNKAIFNNISVIIDENPAAKQYLEKSLLEYTLDEEKYNMESLYDESLLLETICLYCKIRELKKDIKDHKTLMFTNEDKGISNEERNN